MDTIRSLIVASTVVTFALAVACGGGSSSGVNTTPSADADALRDQVVAAMNALDSYHAVFSTGDYTFETDFQKPNSYHSAVVAKDDQTGESTLGETIELGDTVYARKCDPDGSHCEDWDNAPRKEARVGLGSYDPRWPLVALEMADGISMSNGVLRGSVNQIRAVLENTRRLFEAAVVTPSFGCGGDAVATPNEDGCRAETYDEALEGQEPKLSFLDEHPSKIDVEVDPGTHYIKRFTITIVVDEEANAQGVGTHDVTFTYSRYNDVTIEAPE